MKTLKVKLLALLVRIIYQSIHAIDLGRFHVFCVIFMCLTMITNGYLFWALTFLELYPDYHCPIDLPECNHWDYCNKVEGVTINRESHKSLNNWVQKYNLECKAKRFKWRNIFRRRTIFNRASGVFRVCWLDSRLLDNSSAGWFVWKEMACFNFTFNCYGYSYSDSDVRKLVLDSFSFLYLRRMLCRKVFNSFRLYDWVIAKEGSRHFWVFSPVFRCGDFHYYTSLLQIY